MYASWEDYNSIFLLGKEPSISQADFPFWERRARTHVDLVTFDHLHNVDVLEQHREAVILCVCELAEHYASDIMQESRGLSSISITGHSMSFEKDSTANAEREVVLRYLGNTGLLYRGIE